MAPTLSEDEERRGTRQLMMWGAGAAVVLFVVVLVWALAAIPRGELGASARQPSPATGTLANQGGGESQLAKNNMVTPETSPVTGSGQNANGEAAQIEQSATPLKLSAAQRQQIATFFAGKPADRMASADFALSVGAAVPQQVALQTLPPEIATAMNGFKGDQYVLVKDQLVIVDPSARRVVAVVPDIG